MSIRALTCSVLLALAGAQAAVAAEKKPPPEKPPQDIDVDAMARAKDVDARAPAEAPQAAATPAAPEEPAPAAEPSAAAAPAAATAPEAAQPAEPAAAAKAPATSAPAANVAQDALALTPPIDAQEKRLAAACQARSTGLLDAAQKGDFDTATKDFDAKMRKALPAEKFSETWSSLARFGALRARGQAHPSKGEGYFIVMTPLIFDKSNLVAQVACGSDGRIAGFYVKPLAALKP